MEKEFNLSECEVLYRGNDDGTGEEWKKVKDIKEFIKWCETHSHMSEGVQVISINTLKKGAGDKLI